MPLLYTLDGLDREVHVYAPLQWMDYVRNQVPGERRLPIVYVLHGGPNDWDASDPRRWGVTPQQMAEVTRFHEISIAGPAEVPEDDLFFTVYIGGLGSGAGVRVDQPLPLPDVDVPIAGWNTEWTSDIPSVQRGDDVAFFDDVRVRVKWLLRELMLRVTGTNPQVVDSRNEFLVGWGEGGAMAYRLASVRSVFKATAVVGCTNGGRAVATIPLDFRYTPTATANANMALFHLHGRLDDEVRIGDLSPVGVTTLQTSAEDNARVAAENVPPGTASSISRRDYMPITPIADWFAYTAGGTFTVPAPTALAFTNNGSPVQQYEWSTSGGRPIRLWDFNDGHVWPTGTVPVIGNWKATEQIWAFFRALT